jgi:hypothetical protein
LRQSLGAHLADFVQIIGGSPYNATVIPHAAILGSLMPATDYTSNRRGRQRLLLNVAVVAWLSIMVMPCSVLAAGSVEAESPSVESVQPDCHGMHAESKTTANAECCCDALTVTGGEGPKTPRAELVAAAALAVSLTPTPLAASAFERVHPPPLTSIGPPVYLATQRFRI